MCEDEEWQGECKKKQKPRQKHRCLSDEITDNNEVEEDDEAEEGQEYLFFDIETRQDDGQHIANFLNVRDQTGFETVFKGDDCVEQFGTWLLDGTHQGAIVIAHNLRGFDGSFSASIFTKNAFFLNSASMVLK